MSQSGRYSRQFMSLIPDRMEYECGRVHEKETVSMGAQHGFY